MTYVPRVEEVFESLVLDNILAIIKRDFKSALDYFYPVVAAGTPRLDDSIARALGITTLHMDGFTTKPGVGDLFTIAGDSQLYRVISASTLVGTDSDVVFTPGLRKAIPAVDGNEVVTFPGLPDFAQRTLGNFIRLSQPTFAVEPMRGGEDDSGDHENGTLRINLYLTVDDPDPDEAARKLEKYMRALRSVLKTALPSDYTTGATKVTALIPELSWDYNQVAKDANQVDPNDPTKKVVLWLKSVTFDLTLKYLQR